MISENEVAKLKRTAFDMRKNILTLANQAGSKGAHISPALSMVEIMDVLFLHVMKFNPMDSLDKNRDRFILSKGHGALGYYVALYEAGIIDYKMLSTYEQNGGNLPGQPSKNLSLGIEYSGGSLGMGISYGIGIALGAKRLGLDFHTYVLIGDGESDEGCIWEGAMLAKQKGLSNLTVIVDHNGMQSDGFCKDIISYDIANVWKSFGWNMNVCDGHDIQSLITAFEAKSQDKPNVIIANTIKGKGISFMENSIEWHHARLLDSQYSQAMAELEERRPM